MSLHLFNRAPESTSRLVACGRCDRVRIGSRWVGDAEAIRTLRTYECASTPQLAHATCPRCTRRVERLRAAQRTEARGDHSGADRKPRLARSRGLVALGVSTAVLSIASVTAATAASPPVGALPPSPLTKVATQKGQLVAVALPGRATGRVWRVARPFDSSVVDEVYEGQIGNTTVLVFRAVGSGFTRLVFALTAGEGPKAFEARRLQVKVG